MDNGGLLLSKLQLMSLSSHGGRKRSLADSPGVEIPSKRACRELDLFPCRDIIPLRREAQNFIDSVHDGRDHPDVNTDLRLGIVGSEQSMEDDDLQGMHEINGRETPQILMMDAFNGGGIPTGAHQQHSATMEDVRIAFRHRSEATLIPDGWRWRKYGQKGKPPRSYYRCAMTSTCLARKQVQRCSRDKSVLITTYIQWNHDHPLPPAATPTASIISEAASMFLSGSIPISGGPVINNNYSISPMIPHNRPIMATISFSARSPTVVTLDLTESPAAPHIPPQFQAPAQPLQPQSDVVPPLFSRLIYEQSHIVRSAMERCEGPHNLDDIASIATDAILKDPKFKAAMLAAVKSIISGAQ